MSQKIRLWKLGCIDTTNAKNTLFPPPKTFDRFRQLLVDAINTEGDIDIVWGPDVDVQMTEIDQDIDNYIAVPKKDGTIELVLVNG